MLRCSVCASGNGQTKTALQFGLPISGWTSETAVKDYYISIFYSDEDDAYVADIPDLEYCSAVGATPEEALHEVLKAKEAWIAAAQDANREIPEARYRPVRYQIG